MEQSYFVPAIGIRALGISALLLHNQLGRVLKMLTEIVPAHNMCGMSVLTRPHPGQTFNCDTNIRAGISNTCANSPDQSTYDVIKEHTRQTNQTT
jgi:hypothetical protein